MNSETSLPAYKAMRADLVACHPGLFSINICEPFLCSMSDTGERAFCLLQRNREHINMKFLEIQKSTGYHSIFKYLNFIQMIM